MQAEEHYSPAHGNAGDASPLRPASPTLTTSFARHHQPTVDTDDRPSIRRRTTQHHNTAPNSTENAVRIAVVTPSYDDRDAARRKEGWAVSPSLEIRSLKDQIARGDHASDGERWERDEMRLVWQGRIVRDEETVGGIIGNNRGVNVVHTFHLVARRIAGPSRPRLVADSRPTPTPTPTPTVAPVPQAVPSPPPLSRNTQALKDTVHYLLFTSRHHLCHLLATSPLAWNDTIRPPVVDQTTAREAVMSVVRAFAVRLGDREEGWEDWEKAFEGDVQSVWKDMGRKGIEEQISTVWSSRVGRPWADGDAGETASIELDQVPYQLNLPPFRLMSPSQLAHLLLYLRITNLLPLLNNTLAIASTPIPTPTIQVFPPQINLPPPPRITRRVAFRLQVTQAVLSHIFFSSLKALALIWMFTRDMRWDDFRLWIIAGGTMGWWLGDALNRLQPGLIWAGQGGARARAGRQGGQGEPGGAQPGANLPNNVAADAPIHAPAAGVPPLVVPNGAAIRPPRAHVSASSLFARLIPLLHLDIDSEHLHLENGRRPARQPPRILTQFFLPVALWVITLVPDWESARGRAIRQRERSMRVLVGEMSTISSPVEPSTQSDAQTSQTERDQGRAEDRPARVLPPGLSVAATKYYRRVIERGEGIDWEEEREAQRAMGVGEEEDGQGDEMRMRML